MKITFVDVSTPEEAIAVLQVPTQSRDEQPDESLLERFIPCSNNENIFAAFNEQSMVDKIVAAKPYYLCISGNSANLYSGMYRGENGKFVAGQWHFKSDTCIWIPLDTSSPETASQLASSSWYAIMQRKGDTVARCSFSDFVAQHPEIAPESSPCLRQ